MLASFLMAAKSGFSRWGASASGRVWPSLVWGAACGAWPAMTARVSALVPNGLSGKFTGSEWGMEAHLPRAGPGQM